METNWTSDSAYFTKTNTVLCLDMKTSMHEFIDSLLFCLVLVRDRHVLLRVSSSRISTLSNEVVCGVDFSLIYQ